MRDVSVYVHFPWCLRKCPYCDFATLPTERDAIDHVAYADGVLRELEGRRQSLQGARLWSVFFGGGTPSLWEPAQLGRVLAGIREAFAETALEPEVTVECNPSSLDAPRAAALRAQGVGRLSLGVQSLDDDELRFLGRLHDGAGARAALRAAVSEVPRVSADLMFGLPGQDPTRVRGHAQQLLDFGLSHVSAYALTVEPGTPFGAQYRKGQLPLASEQSFADIFVSLREQFAQAGLSHYEVSNYARQGEESRHNLHYWRGGEYLGLGAAAVGRLGSRRYRNHPQPERYLQRAGTEQVEVFGEDLSAEDHVNEALMLGLRTVEGVDVTALRERTGLDVRTLRAEAIQRRVAAGDLRDDGARLSVPRERWLMLDAIVADLF